VCFSPQADLGGGLLIGVIGVDAVRHIRQRREFIALAWIPLLLGAHQFIEALVWLWLQGHVPRGIGHVALWAYLLIAFAVLPVFGWPFSAPSGRWSSASPAAATSPAHS